MEAKYTPAHLILIQQELQLNVGLFLYVKNVSQEARAVAITLNSQYTKNERIC
jgi:hypothetical protein